MGKAQLKFSLSLVAVIVLIAVVVGVVAGRAAGGTSSAGGGGGSGGAAAGKKVDVIIKASNSSFWQTMLAGSSKASKDFGVDVGLFGPAQEIDIPEQVTLVENAVSRGVDAVVLAPNSSNALNNAIKQARKAGVQVVVVDTGVTTDTDGFIGTDNIKAGEQAGKTLCDLAKAQNKATGSVLIESSVAGVQTIKERETGFKRGLAAACPGLKVATTRYNDDKTDKAVSDVNDVLTANPGLVGIFASNVTSGVGVARGVKDNNAADKIPVVAFDTDPQENAALADGSIDALIVQNPYFFGYQGVIEAAMASVGSLPPPKLDPGAVVATTKNMNDPSVKPLLNPPTAKAQS
jgi:ribose transport system substrate-binding protein